MIDLVVSAQHAEGVCVLTLNNPAELNGWSDAMAEAFFAAVDDAVADPAVKVIVIAGAGRAFCAGAALSHLERILSGEVGRPTARPENRRTVAELATIPKPVVAAINGAAAGIGMAVAAACDVRFAADDAKLTTSYARRGLAAEYGIAWLLPRIVGRANAADLLLSGRTIDASEAASMGLVNRIVPSGSVLDAALAYSAEVASHCAPRSLAVIKLQLIAAADQALASSVHQSIAWMEQRLTEPDFREGIASFRERRAPRFTDAIGAIDIGRIGTEGIV